MSARGYFGIGVYHLKTTTNLGTLWRSAHNFGASFIFTIGRRYQGQASDTTKAARHVPLYTYLDFADFNAHRPSDCLLIGVEQCARSRDLLGYHHAERAIYLLGAEDVGLAAAIGADDANDVGGAGDELDAFVRSEVFDDEACDAHF